MYAVFQKRYLKSRHGTADCGLHNTRLLLRESVFVIIVPSICLGRDKIRAFW